MVQTKIEKRQLTGEDHAIIGQLLVEILAGEIGRETREAVWGMGDPLAIPRPYGHLLAYTQGYALSNRELAHDLQEEVRGICVELLDEKKEDPDARSSAWIRMYNLLFEMLEGDDHDIRENIDSLPDPKQAPGWATPLITYAQSTSAKGKELTLGLLDALVRIIKERKEQLS